MSKVIWSSLDSNLIDVLEMTWPMILISVVLLSSIRVLSLLKSKDTFVLHKELLSLFFVIYILCLFQVVTFQDVSNTGTSNFVPFREILRYSVGSKLFIKNIIGNTIMFVPYGFFVSYYCKNTKFRDTFILVTIASIVIECTQMAIGRVFDIDDILLNVLGGIIGFVCYIVINKIGDLCPKIFKSNLFLDILSIMLFICCAGYILWR